MGISNNVPIVFCIVEDPVAMGLIDSLARPGRNLTGFTTGGDALIAKRLQVLKEVAPAIRRLGVLQSNQAVQTLAEIARLTQVAKPLGIDVVIVNVTQADWSSAMQRLLMEKVDATVGTTSMHWSMRKDFPALVQQVRLPAIYDAEEFVDAGGLISISASYAERYRAAAGYVDRILRGARPADLPVQEPTVVSTVINLRAARALGLKIPQAILARADRIVE